MIGYTEWDGGDEESGVRWVCAKSGLANEGARDATRRCVQAHALARHRARARHLTMLGAAPTPAAAHAAFRH
jgi:hypothetical protein